MTSSRGDGTNGSRDGTNGSRDGSTGSRGDSNGPDGAHGGDSEEPHGNRRNVVLVVLDTARATDVDERITPTLTRLAEEGTAFERAFATAPWTLPSHASLFTGTYPTEHGAHGGHTYLDDRFRTVAEAFQDAGYETVGV